MNGQQPHVGNAFIALANNPMGYGFIEEAKCSRQGHP